MIGYAFCGSYCTFSRSIESLKRLVACGYDIQPIMSERAYSEDTRFFKADEFSKLVSDITGKSIIHTVVDAEPLGPKHPLDALIVAPCTGNTLAKISMGITDSAVTMAAKAHLRSDRPLLIALASNDAMSQNLGNIGSLLLRKSVYFVPLCQDDPKKKPHSLVADMESIPEAFENMMHGVQMRPLFLEPK